MTTDDRLAVAEAKIEALTKYQERMLVMIEQLTVSVNAHTKAMLIIDARTSDLIDWAERHGGSQS